MGSGTTSRMNFSFENLMWVFTRVSGVIMVLLALIGLVLAFWMGARTQMDIQTLMRWTFFPNSYHVVNSDIPDVVPGWANAYWQVMQLLIIFFACTHGINGVRVIVEDYLGSTRWRIFWRGLLFLLWVFILVVAFFVILTI